MSHADTLIRFAGIPVRAVLGLVATLFVAFMGFVDPSGTTESISDIWKWVWTSKKVDGEPQQ